MRSRILITAALALALCTSVHAQPTEEQTLLVLADQAFAQLHREYVTLPDLTTERVARSDEYLPLLWPVGEMKGLVKKEYIEEAFLAVGLDGLDEGLWLVFRVTGLEEDVDVALLTWRNTAGVIVFRKMWAEVPDESIFLSPTACGGEDDEKCVCHPPEACVIGCTGENGDAVVNTGETTGPDGTGNQVYEDTTSGQRYEKCGDGKGHITISPI